MKTNKKTIQSAMDARLAFLDERPSCRAAVQYRIAQEEEPVMKKKLSLGLVLAMALVLLTAAALAATLLLSPRAGAVRTADQALEEKYGITAEMQTFFGREEKTLPDGSVEVTYTGVGETAYALGTYTALVKEGRAEISWSHDGENTSGGYEAEAWGIGQIRQMLKDSLDEGLKQAYLDRAAAIAGKYGALESNESSKAIEGLHEEIERNKTAALNARRLTEAEMIRIGREFILSNWGLNDEQAARMELFTNFGREPDSVPGPEENPNGWYDMIDGKPCFQVEYLLAQPEVPEQPGVTENLPRQYQEGDGYYIVYVNVETGEIERFEYNSGLGGQG